MLMNKQIKKAFSIILLWSLVFTNSLFWVSFAKEDKQSNSKKEFDLKTKFSWNKLNKLKNTLSKKDRYELIINSQKWIDELKNYYQNIDKKIKIKKIWENIYKLKIPKDSTLSTNLSWIDNWIIPENI